MSPLPLPHATLHRAKRIHFTNARALPPPSPAGRGPASPMPERPASIRTHNYRCNTAGRVEHGSKHSRYRRSRGIDEFSPFSRRELSRLVIAATTSDRCYEAQSAQRPFVESPSVAFTGSAAGGIPPAALLHFTQEK